MQIIPSTKKFAIMFQKQWLLTTINCALVGRFEVLKKHILMDRISVPISGMAKTASSAHIHATRSSSGRLTRNCLSLPRKQKSICKLSASLLRAGRSWVMKVIVNLNFFCLQCLCKISKLFKITCAWKNCVINFNSTLVQSQLKISTIKFFAS